MSLAMFAGPLWRSPRGGEVFSFKGGREMEYKQLKVEERRGRMT